MLRKTKNFGALLSAAHPAIWRFALTLSGRPDVADDLSQSTILRALERQHQFTGGSVEAWCITICRSIWLNELRAQTVRAQWAMSISDNKALTSVIPDSETNLFATQVFTKVMELPEAHREAVALVYVLGFKYREVAQIQGVPIGTVMSRLSAARKKLVQWSDGEATKNDLR